jgi:hypothetical protein
MRVIPGLRKPRRGRIAEMALAGVRRLAVPDATGSVSR